MIKIIDKVKTRKRYFSFFAAAKLLEKIFKVIPNQLKKINIKINNDTIQFLEVVVEVVVAVDVVA